MGKHKRKERERLAERLASVAGASDGIPVWYQTGVPNHCASAMNEGASDDRLTTWHCSMCGVSIRTPLDIWNGSRHL